MLLYGLIHIFTFIHIRVIFLYAAKTPSQTTSCSFVWFHFLIVVGRYMPAYSWHTNITKHDTIRYLFKNIFIPSQFFIFIFFWYLYLYLLLVCLFVYLFGSNDGYALCSYLHYVYMNIEDSLNVRDKNIEKIKRRLRYVYSSFFFFSLSFLPLNIYLTRIAVYRKKRKKNRMRCEWDRQKCQVYIVYFIKIFINFYLYHHDPAITTSANNF